MVEQIKKAMGGWSIGKDVNISTMITILALGFTLLWATKDKVDTIDRNATKLVDVEIGYMVSDDEIRNSNRTDFVAISDAISEIQEESQQRDLLLQKLVITQGYITETLSDISERLDQ